MGSDTICGRFMGCKWSLTPFIMGAMKRLLATIAAAAALLAHAQGVSDSEIVLGQSVALTGPSEQLGKDMQLGAKLYFDQVNARGGINGRKVTLKTLDDGYEPPRAAENTKKLIN